MNGGEEFYRDNPDKLVEVAHPRYHGQAKLVQYFSGTRYGDSVEEVLNQPTVIYATVMLPNGNIWSYEAETVTLVTPELKNG